MIVFDNRAFLAGLSRVQRNITTLMDGDADHVDIFVPINSPAGKYAKRIHDEKGSTWRNRGVGTQQKGAKADERFIERAIKDDTRKIDAQFRRGFSDAIRGTSGAFRSALNRVGLLVQRTARKYAPRSPSKAQYKRTLKTARGRKNSTFKATPGGLEKSITYEVG